MQRVHALQGQWTLSRKWQCMASEATSHKALSFLPWSLGTAPFEMAPADEASICINHLTTLNWSHWGTWVAWRQTNNGRWIGRHQGGPRGRSCLESILCPSHPSWCCIGPSQISRWGLSVCLNRRTKDRSLYKATKVGKSMIIQQHITTPFALSQSRSKEHIQ